MTCLAPLALIGVLLLALPIIVHLFKPRKMKQMPFSSLRWLKETHQRLSRRIQWHQWLLFLMRAGCILLLVLALAKPLFGLWGAKSVDRIVVIDVSRSMAYRTSDQTTSLDRATELAGRYVQTARVGDRTSVIVAGTSPRLLAPPSADASPALPGIKALQPGQADGSLSASLPLIRTLLPRQKDRAVEIVFLTDNLKGRWQEPEVRNFLSELPNPVNVKVIETGAGAAANAWIADARTFQFGPDEDRWIHVLVGCNSEPNVGRSVRLTGIAGLGDDTQAVELKPGQRTRVDFRIPASVSLQGQVAELRLEPDDALPSDDVFFVNLDSGLALRVLLIEPKTPGGDGRNVGLFLQTALKALAAAKNQSLEVTTRTSASVTPSDLQKSDVVLLAGVPELSDGVLESLETRVRAGVGLALFLGPQLRPGFVNQKLHRAQQPAEGLLPFSLKTEGSSAGKSSPLTNLRWAHPVLASLQDPVLSDLTQSRFRHYAKLVGVAGKNDTTLARFDDDVPAIVEHPLGTGRVLIFNTSANDEWSDLPRRTSFVPLIDAALGYLSTGNVRRSYTVGTAISVPLAEVPAGGLSVSAPSGAKLPARFAMRMLHLDELAEAGAYRIEGAGSKSAVFVANAPRRDSPLIAMDNQALEQWLGPAGFEALAPDAAAQQLAQQSSHWPLWPMLVLFAGLLLVGETIYVHWLCPRANPKAAEAVVPQRGMLKPVEKSPA